MVRRLQVSALPNEELQKFHIKSCMEHCPMQWGSKTKALILESGSRSGANIHIHATVQKRFHVFWARVSRLKVTAKCSAVAPSEFIRAGSAPNSSSIQTNL